MKYNGYENMSEVQAYYTNRHLDIVRGLGAKSIIWQDPLDAGVTVINNTLFIFHRTDMFECRIVTILQTFFELCANFSWIAT